MALGFGGAHPSRVKCKVLGQTRAGLCPLSLHARPREVPQSRAIWQGRAHGRGWGSLESSPSHPPPQLAVVLPTHPQPLTPSAQPQLHFRIPKPQPGTAALRPALTSGIKQRPSPLANPPPFRPRRPRGPSAYLGSRLLRVSLSVSPPRNCIRGQKGPVFVHRIRCRRLRWLGVVREAAELARQIRTDFLGSELMAKL